MVACCVEKNTFYKNIFNLSNIKYNIICYSWSRIPTKIKNNKMNSTHQWLNI